MGLAVIPLALTAVAAVAATAATVKASQSQQASARYNASLAQENANIAQQQGDQDAAVVNREGEAVAGQERAAAAANGLDGGSSNDISFNSLVNNEQQALNYKYRGTIAAFGSNASASLDNSSAENSASALPLSAAGTLLSGASSTYSMYSNTSPSAVQGIFGNSGSGSSYPSFS